MNPDTYALAAEAEEEHWWFVGRRAILRAVLDRYFGIKEGRQVLEVGCGNGGNFTLLARYGSLFAAERDDGARSKASARGIAKVEMGDLPDAIPFRNQTFDLVAALDVLEHVDDDALAVKSLAGRLHGGGMLLVTVPAYGWLWSSHDEWSQHKRRYTARRLTDLIEDAGLRLAYTSYFNTLLFPVGVANAKLSGILGYHPRKAMSVPPRLVNSFLCSVFSAERALIPYFALPFGISIVSCAFLK